jgi:hypothetical protein
MLAFAEKITMYISIVLNCVRLSLQCETGAIVMYLQNKYVKSMGPEDLGKIAQWVLVCNSTVVSPSTVVSCTNATY